METVVSGIRSTGQLHLGNYFGALKNFVKMQHTDRCFFFIADYHSLTTHPDPKALHGNVRNVLLNIWLRDWILRLQRYIFRVMFLR